MLENISSLLAEIEEGKTLEAVRQALAAETDPLSVIEALRNGMGTVGERFESKDYFLPDLIMAAEIFKESIELINPHLKGVSSNSRGTIVMGTVQGDIHDIGKNLVVTMLRCNGFEVHDLGTDVSPEAFVAKVRETGAKLVGMSGLLTLAFDAMKNTVEALEEAGLRDRVKILIGGGPVNEAVLDYAGADAYGKDPTEAIRLASAYLG
jgi:corrinoid protein of di/trimethylamine methyltransferase